MMSAPMKISIAALKMWYGIALAEFSVSFVLWCVTFLLVAAIIYKSSVRHLYKNSPSLAFIFAICLLSGVFSMALLLFWISILTGLFPDQRKRAQLLLTLDMLVQSSRFEYDVATLALFVRRLTILVAPMKPRKFLVKFHVMCTILLSCGIVAAVIQLYIFHILGDASPIPEGCFSGLCLSQLRNKYTLPLIFRLTLTLSILSVGMAFLLLLRRKKFKSAADDKINKTVRYLFYIRILMEFLPVVTDTIVSKTFGIYITSYIGPYTIVGYAVECTASIFSYYKVLSRKTHKVGTAMKSSLEIGLRVCGKPVNADSACSASRSRRVSKSVANWLTPFTL
uniref:G_PROTEIN_RECEP_F1_2 domain-containing protein n=1 Tax=Steinernema glaseri TaxID=37863 RepID=A0A1I7ZSY5_9BILA